MAAPSVLILRAPGTNCDVETANAFAMAGARTETLHIRRILERPALVHDFQILCIPGGFSYGDDLAAGRILADQMRLPLQETLDHFCQQQKLVLGICNGFQVLLRSGLLGPITAATTLTWNDSAHFEARWVNLSVTGNRCVFLQGIDHLYLPIAHAEGKFVARDRATYQALDEHQQLVLRYGAAQDVPSDEILPFPHNPNGSQGNVAGVCDPTGRIFGLMPHPERHVRRTQHPHWTRLSDGKGPDGLQIFANAVQFFA